MSELQPSIEEKETTGQLFAVAPLAAVATATASGEGDDEASTSPQHDAAANEDGDDDGQLLIYY